MKSDKIIAECPNPEKRITFDKSKICVERWNTRCSGLR